MTTPLPTSRAWPIGSGVRPTHWLIMGRRPGAIGTGYPIAHYTGPRMVPIGAIYAAGYEPTLPPMIPVRYGVILETDSRIASDSGIGSIIGPAERAGTFRLI